MTARRVMRILGLTLLGLTAGLAPVAWWWAGSSGLGALLLAAAVGGAPPLVAWRAVGSRLRTTQHPTTQHRATQYYVGIGFSLRTGVPLATCTFLCWQDPEWIQTGLVGWTLVVYEGMLLTETMLVVYGGTGQGGTGQEVAGKKGR